MSKEDQNSQTRLVIDCGPGVGIDEILQKFAEQESRCKIRTAETAKAMIKSGAVTSEREAAKVIAEQTGEKENTVRQRIKRGKHVGTVVPTSENAIGKKSDGDKIGISLARRIQKLSADLGSYVSGQNMPSKEIIRGLIDDLFDLEAIVKKTYGELKNQYHQLPSKRSIR